MWSCSPLSPAFRLLLTSSLHCVSFSALCAGQTGGEVGQAAAANHPVLPGGLRSVRGLHPRLRLQAPLERRADGAAAGRACRRAQRESAVETFIMRFLRDLHCCVSVWKPAFVLFPQFLAQQN